ncbi:MAG: zinc-ribbon domain-containing protein [Coleofasciculaceae cyanobacterium SM2_3_26]|nr:zinc-ribbon domain-containing protein [Coleofasciculaceae cyanobacterium SM2_3_26]
MLVCPECGFHNPDRHRFCQQCGTSLAHKSCDACGAKVDFHLLNCPSCGAQTGTTWLAIASLTASPSTAYLALLYLALPMRKPPIF